MSSLVNVVLAVETSADVLAQALNDAHVLEPAVVLLLAFAGSITDIRLRRRRADRDGRLRSLGSSSAAGRLLRRPGGSSAGTLKHASRVASTLAVVKAGAEGRGCRLAKALVNSGKASREVGVHDG